METLIIFVIATMTVAAIVCTIFFISWLKAERKLARYGKSSIFVRKTK